MHAILMFLSFAIAAAVLLWSNRPSPLTSRQLDLVVAAMKWWVRPFFLYSWGLPLKDVRDDDVRWYNFLRWAKFWIVWAAIICIGWGAVDFVRGIKVPRGSDDAAVTIEQQKRAAHRALTIWGGAPIMNVCQSRWEAACTP
jgi:hypothetical protein